MSEEHPIDSALYRDGIKGSDMEPIYSGVLSFMRRRYSRDFRHPDVDVVVTGVPFDLATTHRSGTRFGPAGVRAASANLAWEQKRWPWGFNAFERLGVIDYGDVVFESADPQSMVDGLQAHARQVLDAGKSMLSFGGDHFIALPLLREHARKHGPVALLHFDAHTDTYSKGARFDHGTMFYHAVQEGLLQTEHSVQVGIRTEYEDDNPLTVLDAAWVNEAGQ